MVLGWDAVDPAAWAVLADMAAAVAAGEAVAAGRAVERSVLEEVALTVVVGMGLAPVGEEPGEEGTPAVVGQQVAGRLAVQAETRAEVAEKVVEEEQPEMVEPAEELGMEVVLVEELGMEVVPAEDLACQVVPRGAVSCPCAFCWPEPSSGDSSVRQHSREVSQTSVEP